MSDSWHGYGDAHYVNPKKTQQQHVRHTHTHSAQPPTVGDLRAHASPEGSKSIDCDTALEQYTREQQEQRQQQQVLIQRQQQQQQEQSQQRQSQTQSQSNSKTTTMTPELAAAVAQAE